MIALLRLVPFQAWVKLGFGIAGVMALLYFAHTQREAGRDEIRVNEAKEVEKARDVWEENRNRSPDFDAAIERLRRRDD